MRGETSLRNSSKSCCLRYSISDCHDLDDSVVHHVLTTTSPSHLLSSSLFIYFFMFSHHICHLFLSWPPLSFISPLHRCRNNEARFLSVNYHNQWWPCHCVTPHCCSLHHHLHARSDSGETHYHLWSCSCSERLGSFPGSGAWSSALCIIALNFNLYQVTLKCKENKQAEPLAASLAIVFLTIGSQHTTAGALSAKTHV